jgi:restriction system protein
MSRRAKNRFDQWIGFGSKLPWWTGVLFAWAAYAWLHAVAAREAAAVIESVDAGRLVGQTTFLRLVSVGQYLVPLGFLSVAAVSAYGRFRRRALHPRETTTPGRSALNAMSGSQFELLMGESFRRKGYAVPPRSGCVEGGLDLALKKGGDTFLVRYKQWRAIRVGADTVRELDAVMAERGVTGGFVVTSGTFTDEARAFALGKRIELIDGTALHALIRGVSVPAKVFRDPLSLLTTGAPFCPECQSRMRQRKVRSGPQAGKAFWRCLRYPDCKGKRPC